MAKSIVITGPSGSGKTTRAIAEAEKIGKYVVVNWDVFECKFGMAGAMKESPQVVIVEGMPIPFKRKQRAILKKLVTDNKLWVREKFQEPREIDAPIFIFTVNADASIFTYGQWFNRLDFIHLQKQDTAETESTNSLLNKIEQLNKNDKEKIITAYQIFEDHKLLSDAAIKEIGFLISMATDLI